MADKRDLLDEIIDIQSGFQALSHPLDSLADALTGENSRNNAWDPSRYKDRPTTTKGSCIRYLSDCASSCRACMDVCPVDAIHIEQGSMKISDECRQCGLCVGACPTEALKSHFVSPRSLYDAVARGATAHEMCYVTCTRALGRYPKPNELVIACVGAVSAEVWFSLLSEFDNVAIYLPLGICDKCRNTTGERAYSNAIAQAEEWSCQSMGLEVSEEDLNHETRREWERKQFVNNVVRSTAAVMGKANPMVRAVQTASNRIQEHNKQLRQLESSINAISGSPSDHRRRVLIQRRQLLMGTLQKLPELANNFDFKCASCDSSLCTMCGDCVKVCPTHALLLDKQGRVCISASHCIACDACSVVCQEGALSLVPASIEDIVIHDKAAEVHLMEEDRNSQELERLKEAGKRRFEQGLASLGKMLGSSDTSPESSSAHAASAAASATHTAASAAHTTASADTTERN